MSKLSLLSGVKRKLDFGAVKAAFDPGCVKTHTSLSSPELFSQLPASDGSCQCNLISTATKSRWKFYTKVRYRSFHTAWTLNGHVAASVRSLGIVRGGCARGEPPQFSKAANKVPTLDLRQLNPGRAGSTLPR